MKLAGWAQLNCKCIPARGALASASSRPRPGTSVSSTTGPESEPSKLLRARTVSVVSAQDDDDLQLVLFFFPLWNYQIKFTLRCFRVVSINVLNKNRVWNAFLTKFELLMSLPKNEWRLLRHIWYCRLEEMLFSKCLL